MKSLRMTPFFVLLLIGTLATSLQTLAAPVTREQAQQNAMAFMAQRGKAVAVSSLRVAPMRFSATWTAEPLYLFNIGDNQGYVIASGDDCAPAVLGYSDCGSLDVNTMPENMRGWLDEYASQIQFMRDHGLSCSRTRARSDSMPAIPPLLTTGWDQLNPFNRACPLTPSGNHYPAGCVATAMAQVLYYHRANSVSHTTHEMTDYITSGGVYVDAIPAGSFIDWDNILDSYWRVSATQEQLDAVAWLMRYCGSAVHMQYALGGSTARMANVPMAMVAYFNYSSKAEAIVRNESGLSDEEWENLVYSELSNSRPLVYSGGKPSYQGHAFVCDGYDGEGYFHINWGWTNTMGYYLLTAIDSDDPALLDFYLNQCAVVHAEPRPNLPSPDAGIRFADPLARAVCLQTGDVDDDGTLTAEEAQAITGISKFYASGVTSFDEFQYFTGITTVSDRMFSGCEYLKSVTLHDNITAIGRNAFYGCRSLKEFTMPCSVTVFRFQAFMGCDSLKHFIWNARQCGFDYMASLPSAVEWLTFGDSVIVIPGNAAKSSKITRLDIGKSVTVIGASAFYKCKGLKRVKIADAVTKIGGQAFFECSGLEELVLGKSVSSIGDRAFDLCSNLRHVTIPDSVTSIGSYAFYSCTNLRSLVIGKSVTALNVSAFARCDSLKTVTCLLHEPLEIRSNVFENVYNHATLRVPADAVEAYRATSPWNQFADIVAIDPTSGDVNLDGVTSIDDLTELINQLLKGETPEYSDVDADGSVNIDDVNALINKILNHQ